MIISSIGGIILDKSIAIFKGIAPYQPVINGVGGNLVAIQASRISTFLHMRQKEGELPKDDGKVFRSPCAVFFSSKQDASIARILFAMAIPAHLIYLYIIDLIQPTHITLAFASTYLLIALFEVFFLLYLARVLIYWLWNRNSDPDDSAIPLLTATGDLVGTGLLTLGFYLLTILRDPTVQT
jgi:solute carrier family 41